MIELIIFIILILDAIAANLIAWFGSHWWTQLLGSLSRYFPMAKGWAAWYLILVLWIGYLTLIDKKVVFY